MSQTRLLLGEAPSPGTCRGQFSALVGAEAMASKDLRTQQLAMYVWKAGKARAPWEASKQGYSG